jgi:D-lactate dehydrogenase
MKIAIFEADRECAKTFEPLNPDIYQEPVQTLQNPVEYEAISIFIRSRIDDATLSLFPKLRYIQTRSTGYDHIDLAACKKRGIKVTNVQGYAGPAVGEFAFSLLLNVTRKTWIAIERTKRGDRSYKDLLGTELFGKTIGIVGLGTIGKRLAHIAYGFGMKIIAHSRSYDETLCENLGIQKSALDPLLERCDAVVLALPLTTETYHIIDKNRARLLQPHAVLINIGRGELVSLEALERLGERIYGIGIDVIEGEKEWGAKQQAIVKKQNILYTPHMAYYTKEALERIRTISFENMRRFLNGDELKFELTARTPS